MFSRAYTSLSRITIEAADCKLNYQNLNGHLTIFVEPIDPVLPTGNRDPLIGQRPRQNITTTTRPNDRIETDRNNVQPSTSYAQQNAMIADSTHRSPQLPSQIVEPLHLQPSAIPSSNNLPPVASEYDEEDYSQNDDSENENENEIKQENTGPNTPPNPTLDPIHMPEKENETPQEDIPQKENEIPQEDIPHNENENDRPHTPDPNNPIEDTTDFPNSNYVIPEQDDQPQPGTSNSNSDPNSNSALAKFIESPDFEETMRKMTLQVGESTFNNIAKNPKLVKQWILQVIHKFPGLLDEQTDDTVQFVDTDRGQVRIMQPNPTQNPQPLDQDHDTSQVREVASHSPLTLQQEEENNDTPTLPSSTSPGIILSGNSDDDSDSDCYIAKISPGYKRKSLKRAAPPPEVSSPHVILKKIPHKQGTRAYTITQTPATGHTTTTIKAEIHGQPTTTNTGPEQNTPKRPRLNDNTPQPSTSTGTDTSQNHKDKKHRKHKKDKKKDKDN